MTCVDDGIIRMTVKQRACADVERSQAELQSTPRSQSSVESNPGT